MKISVVENPPLISIITVVYNDRQRIEATLLSFVKQKYNNAELIVIDGGSTDGTVDIIKVYEPYIHFWVSERDSGIYDAMNKGLKYANGEFIYYLNSGDSFYKESVLSEIAQQIRDNNKPILCGKVMVTSADKPGEILDVFPKFKVNGQKFRELFRSSFCHQALFVARDSYLEVGGFDTEFRYFSDFYAVSKIIKTGEPPVYIENTIAFFDGEGVSSNWRNVKKLEREKTEILKLLGEKRSAFLSFLDKVKVELFLIKKMSNAYFNR